MLSLGWLYTDDPNNDNDNDTNNNDSDRRRTNHDCIGSLACILNEPKGIKIPYWHANVQISIPTEC